MLEVNSQQLKFEHPLVIIYHFQATTCQINLDPLRVVAPIGEVSFTSWLFDLNWTATIEGRKIHLFFLFFSIVIVWSRSNNHDVKPFSTISATNCRESKDMPNLATQI